MAKWKSGVTSAQIDKIVADIATKRTEAKLRLKVKASCGCELCDVGHRPDGPKGHCLDGQWIACPLQPRRAPTLEEMLRADRIFDQSDKKLGRPKKSLEVAV